jgi:hypothetical protein
MIDATTVADYLRYNTSDTQAIIRSVIKPVPAYGWDDIEQSFYLTLLTHPVLERYDSSRAAYSTYLYRVIDNHCAAVFNLESRFDRDMSAVKPYPDVSEDTLERIDRFKTFIRKHSRHVPEHLRILQDKAEGRFTKSYGQSLWLSFNKIRDQFLDQEKSIEL